MDEERNQKLGELILDLAQGNISALDGIAQLIEKTLYAVGNIYYNNLADIEDAIQNLYLTLYGKAKKFKRNRNAIGWIIVLYENRIKSDLRRRKREQIELQNEFHMIQASITDESDKYLEKHLLLKEVFDRLDKEEEKIIIYYFWHGCSIREIASMLHKSKSAIHKKLDKLTENINNLKNFK